MTVAEPPTVSQVAAAPNALYDARRGVHYSKPLLRGWLHLLYFQASLVTGTLLLVHARGVLHLTAAAVYAASVSALFGASALYHRGNWTSAWRQRFLRLDQTAIYFLIAGSATPAFLLAVPGVFRVAGLVILWALTIAATALRMARMNAPERLAGATFLGLGMVAGLALPEVWIHDGVTPGLLMIIGCLLYVAGAISYHRRWPNPFPSVFGYHEVFHAYVCAAAACQYVAIAMFVT